MALQNQRVEMDALIEALEHWRRPVPTQLTLELDSPASDPVVEEPPPTDFIQTFRLTMQGDDPNFREIVCRQMSQWLQTRCFAAFFAPDAYTNGGVLLVTLKIARKRPFILAWLRGERLKHKQYQFEVVPLHKTCQAYMEIRKTWSLSICAPELCPNKRRRI
jgi:hypothetical protein